MSKEEQKKILKSIPAKEIRWVRTETPSGGIYLTTSSLDRSSYYLYRKCAEGYERIAREKTPKSFDSIIQKDDEANKTR